MKKFVLCMMLAGLMMPVIAQEKFTGGTRNFLASEFKADFGLSGTGILPMNPKGTLIDVDGWEYAGTSLSYDRQTQGNVYPMTKVHDDGFIGMTWTNEDNVPFEGPVSSSLKTRGVAYAYSRDGGITWEGLTLRVGGIPLYWPSYAQWGKEGEAILARNGDDYVWEDEDIVNGLVLLTREKKGEGEWTRRMVPYPAGTPHEFGKDDWIMAWSRMTTSGDNNQYIHIFAHTRWGDADAVYEGYTTPVFYYRTSDGGETWDISGKLIPDEVSDMEWPKDPEEPSFTDNISIASRGDVVAVSFINMGFHAYMLKSEDNGETWTAKNFFYSDVNYYGDPTVYSDTCHIPVQGTIAVDINGKVHIAFSTWRAYNGDDGIWISYGPFCSILSYWNEDMDPLDCDDYRDEDIENLIFDEFIDDSQMDDWEHLYMISTTPKMPIVGFFTPTKGGDIFTGPAVSDYEWVLYSYGRAGTFSFPQMDFSFDNTLHFTYLGLLDEGADGARWMRHPYYTTRDEDGNWTKTEYLINMIDLIDREFAYLTSAGIYKDKLYLMAQVDNSAGTYAGYVGTCAACGSQHDKTTNYYYFFNFTVPYEEEAINEVGYTPLTMKLFPNPAEGKVNVNFEGKGNITVSNMLGQTVYHVENVENQKEISLSSMATGVYFVTVRSGNATATQKLIVK